MGKKKKKSTNTDLQNTIRKIKDRVAQYPLKLGVNSDVCEG